MIDNLALFERKYKSWIGSYRSLEDILEFENNHWQIARVISKDSNLIELLIIDSNEVIKLNNDINLFGPKKVPPSYIWT